MITRFAPSPTGPLHLGHAFSAILAHDMARVAGGRFLLRIEDIDKGRSRPEWEALIREDLSWLGLTWDESVMRQSERQGDYRAALDQLWARGLLYPCQCNRRDIAAAAAAPHEGDLPVGPDGVIYPGTCRRVPEAGEILPDGAPLRLNLAALSPRVLRFVEEGAGPGGETGAIAVPLERLAAEVGDPVLARRDMGTSYHLSVVVDDAAQGITHVIRGQDLFGATQIHVLLQGLLDLPVPVYHHHRLIRDAGGRRLAKRDDARAIRTFREAGASPADIRAMVGL